MRDHIRMQEGRLGGFVFYSADLGNPSSADAAINALASAEADGANADLIVRAFDDTAEEGVYVTFEVPASASQVTLRLHSRAKTGPVGVKIVKLNWYEREVSDNAAVTAWSAAVQIGSVGIGNTDALFDVQAQTLPLVALGLTPGKEHQIELCRDATDVGDTLVGDWILYRLEMEFG
jgi:hypothetical protein